jgi:mannose-6-phosphate isomerase
MQAESIGEVWFQADLPLLVKFIFTSSRLSVQVHPDDEFAAKYENSRGKTEMWHILRAEPGGQIALGFREALTPARLRETARSGEIVDLLNWVDVQVGDTFLIPAGTVHAIGAGLALCEIQQHSDVTYRIYDYGRDREIHLDKAIQVCDTAALDATPVSLPLESRFFHTEMATTANRQEFVPNPRHFELAIFLEGAGSIAGQPYRAGEAWLVPAGTSSFQVEPGARITKMLRTWVPSSSD